MRWCGGALAAAGSAAILLGGCASSEDDRTLGVRMADAFGGTSGERPGDADAQAELGTYDYQPPDVTDAGARVEIHSQLERRITVFNAAARWRAGELSRVRVPARAITEVSDLGARYRFTFYNASGTPIDDGTGWQWKRMPPNEPVYFEGASLGGGAADWYLEVEPAGLYPHALTREVGDDPRTRAPNQLRVEFESPELTARDDGVTTHGYLGPKLKPTKKTKD